MKKIAVLVLLALIILTSSMTTYAIGTDIVGPDVITKEANNILTITDILSLYQSDVGSIILSEDNYTGYGNILGVHTISLYASNGTIAATKNVEIYVVADLGNVQCVTDYKDIHVKIDQILTPSEIVYTLENSGYIEITTTTQMLILSNTYTENAETPGVYLFEFRLVNSAGLDQTYSSQIFVSDSNDLFVPDVVFVPEASAADQIFNFIINIIIFLIVAYVSYLAYQAYKKHKKNRKKGI